jgi:hypothetical protein
MGAAGNPKGELVVGWIGTESLLGGAGSFGSEPPLLPPIVTLGSEGASPEGSAIVVSGGGGVTPALADALNSVSAANERVRLKTRIRRSWGNSSENTIGFLDGLAARKTADLSRFNIRFTFAADRPPPLIAD